MNIGADTYDITERPLAAAENDVGARVFDFKTGSFWNVPDGNVVLPAAEAYYINPRHGRWKSSYVGTEGPAALLPAADLSLRNLGVLLFNGGEAYAKECLAEGRTLEDNEDIFEYMEDHTRRCIWVIKVCFGSLDPNSRKDVGMGMSFYYPLTYTQASQLKQHLRAKANMLNGKVTGRTKLFHSARFAPSFGWARTVSALTTNGFISTPSVLPVEDDNLRLDLLCCSALRRWGEHFKCVQERKGGDAGFDYRAARVRHAVVPDPYAVATARSKEWAKKVAAAYKEGMSDVANVPSPTSIVDYVANVPSPTSVVDFPTAPPAPRRELTPPTPQFPLLRRELTPPEKPVPAKRRLSPRKEESVKRARVDKMRRVLAMPMSSTASSAMMAGHKAAIGGTSANTNRASMEVFPDDVLAHIGAHLLKTDPIGACALRLASKRTKHAVEDSMVETLHKAEGNLKTCLRGNIVSDIAASANSIAEDGMDALKLLHRMQKKNKEGRDWNAADFGHVTFSSYSGGNPLCKLKLHVPPANPDSRRG